MNIDNLNISMLKAFTAIHSTLSVSKAARELHLSQPALSHLLNKLRDFFDDPLFQKTPTGMQPTLKASQLLPEVTVILKKLQSLANRDEAFDPKTSTRTFNIISNEFGELWLLPELIKYLDKISSPITIYSRQLGNELIDEKLQTDEIDLAIRQDYKTPASIDKIKLYQTDYCCLTDRKHPLNKQRKTLNRYLSYRHITCKLPQLGLTHAVDQSLKRLNKTRDIAMTINHHQSMPIYIRDTELIATVPTLIADYLLQHWDFLEQWPTPFPAPQVDISLFSAKRNANDPGLIWLKVFLQRLAHQTNTARFKSFS